MDTGTYSDDEYTPPSSPEDPIYTSFGGGMFAGSQHFTIGGGTFDNNNTTNHFHPAPVGPPDFRMIPMGDIDLQQELMVNEESGVIDRRLGHERSCVRRVYSAKVDGRNTDLTVAMYEGDGAEEAWQQDVGMYMSLRHPNIIQMYGTASSSAMYATIFHGDLIPFQQFVASASPIITVYIYACYVTEWLQARTYVERSPYQIGLEMHSTLSIRRSNGRLCVDFSPQPDGKSEGNKFFVFYAGEYHPPINPSLDPTSQEAAVIHSLTLEEYHSICVSALSRYRYVSISSSATISSGAVFLCPPNGQLEEDAEIAYLPGAQLDGGVWDLGEERLNGVRMENGWTRFDAKGVCNRVLAYTLDFPVHYWNIWLTQANHIFSRLRITSHLDDYAVVYWVGFQITIGDTREDSPPGYLFLCPGTDFQLGPSSFRWPDCPAYWSLDPSGVDRLSSEEVTQRGFPSFQLTTQVHERSWDTSVYAGLRQFHQAKGFDPESQDVARHLGERLYKLSREVDSPFAYVEEDWSDNGTNEGETDDEWEDAQSSVEVEDGDESTQNSDANEEEGLLNVCTEPHEQCTAEARQELAYGVDQDPNPAELRILSAGVTERAPSSSPTPPGSVTLAAAFALLIGYLGPLPLLSSPSSSGSPSACASFQARSPPSAAPSTSRLRPPHLQSVLGYCGYFSPFVEATVSATCPAIMAPGLLCSNHVTYRFAKGMMPKAYRLSREAMAVIREQYASAQMPPNPFSPNPTPAASASDLNLAGPQPHQDEDEEGDGYSYGYGSRMRMSEGPGGNM
ncbi:hypothetical protein B0H16DRAFT_1897984 [Mycena metata]|uniref:Protein kinase domain-containing protein n=1 Tax=Mycena metata TaxID=1033252 RepID=A0AAD7MHP8_9AGAR|nr:hypothetical protein B0H16DRAFT_1897984 [Mycena metata]